MSEIQRFDPCDECSCLDMSARQGLFVLFTDHEAAIEERDARIEEQARTIRALYKSEAATQRMFWTANAELADAKARIEDLHYGDDNLLIGTGYQLAVNDALAALTQKGEA